MGRLSFALPALVCLLLAGRIASGQTIGQAKLAPDGAKVTVQGIVTTVEPVGLYIEASNRSSGIWVLMDTTGITPSSLLSLMGTIRTFQGERFIGDVDNVGSSPFTQLRPLGMNNRAVGGGKFGYQDCATDYKLVKIPNDGTLPQWAPASGLNNTGLLVTTWGRVRTTYFSPTNNTSWFYIDDGSELTSDLGDKGLLVYSDAVVQDGDFITVTGISSVEPCLDDPGKLIRVIRPRFTSDVAVVSSVPARIYPFSDEFNSSTIDPRWTCSPDKGAISVTSNPGWVKLVMPINGGQGPELIQRIWSSSTSIDWDIKLHADFASDPTAVQRVCLMVRDVPFYDPKASPVPLCAAAIENNPSGRYIIGYSGRINAPGVNTCSFRVRRGQFSYSIDGVNWTTLGNGYCPYKYWAISIYSTSNSTTGKPFAGYCDYFRLTGGQ